MSNLAFFVSDIHGSISQYQKLFSCIEKDKPQAVFLGGDLLPSGLHAFTSAKSNPKDFINDILVKGFLGLKGKLGDAYPRVFLILGNDDGAADEHLFIEAQELGIWEYVHGRKVGFDQYEVYGYSFVPPTPFMLKDWERYDVSRYVDPGCTPPEEGAYTIDVNRKLIPFQTIKKDLDALVDNQNLEKAIFLFHSPPYKTKLDRAALDGKMYEHVPLDVHVGSIAIQRFLEDKQPYLSMHGHVHESSSITGSWVDQIGKTVAMNAAHNGKELSLVKINLDDLQSSSRELI